MKLVIQRVTRAAVYVDGETVGKIGGGFLVLFGAGAEDTRADCERLAQKLINLRIFADENGNTDVDAAATQRATRCREPKAAGGKINLSLKDVGGELLIISQFTLYADCRKGNRPNFLAAKEPNEAEALYEYFCECCACEIPVVERGIFGADMSVELINDGPFTVILESRNGEILNML